MTKATSLKLPGYLKMGGVLPSVLETRSVFSERPFLFQDFVGKGLAYLGSKEVEKMGFEFAPDRLLPSKWKCADESLFGADLTLFAYTGHYPFDKGKIGGLFNEGSVGAAVHHGKINVDFGGSHTGYLPGKKGGSFGRIWRPLAREYSTDCGAMMALLAPFTQVYRDACENILIMRPRGKKSLISIPNEFIHPSLSSTGVKLLVNLEGLTQGSVAFDAKEEFTHAIPGRSLFYAHPEFLKGLPAKEQRRLSAKKPAPIGKNLTPALFEILDENAAVDRWGLPVERLHLYMKFIVADTLAPPGLKAAIINTSIEHNRLTDTVRSPAFRPYSFACFNGVFIDLFDEKVNNYVNLFAPLGLTIKPAGQVREIEITHQELRRKIKRLKAPEPRIPLENVLGYKRPARVLNKFTYAPGRFEEGG